VACCTCLFYLQADGGKDGVVAGYGPLTTGGEFILDVDNDKRWHNLFFMQATFQRTGRQSENC
jgi:hypothetical protein